RLDTSNTLVDKYFLRNQHVLGTFDPSGVNPELVFALREALDAEGFHYVKIVVSGGCNEERIREFEAKSVHVDMYGVGRNFISVNYDLTRVNVLLNGTHSAKYGRKYRPNHRLEEVSYLGE